MKKIFVTTFNKKLFDKYAYKLIDSYIQTKQSLTLYCYVEDDIKLYPKFKNVIFLNLFESQPENKKFIDRNLNKFNHIAKLNYILNAPRFSYKVFAQSDARKYADHIFYIDSDTYFINYIPEEWFNKCLPNNVFISLYDRLGYYTETGFLAFNNNLNNDLGNKLADVFFDLYVSYYTKDLIYCLPAFTDCHALDATRYRFLFLTNTIANYKNYLENQLTNKKLWFKHNDLDVMKNDEFINQYIIHKKGLIPNE